MRVKLYGVKPIRGTVAVIGTWNPFLPSDESLLKSIHKKAKKENHSTIVVLFSPKPAEVLFNRQDTRYECVESIIDNIQACGIQTILKIKMSIGDLNGGAKAFLSYLKTSFYLKELFLGPSQSLGFAHTGNQAEIKRVCKLLEVRLHLIKFNIKKREEMLQFRSYTADGDMNNLVKLFNRNALWKKQNINKIYLGWKAGWYFAILRTNKKSIPCKVQVKKSTSCSYFLWPKLRGVKQIDIVCTNQIKDK